MPAKRRTEINGGKAFVRPHSPLLKRFGSPNAHQGALKANARRKAEGRTQSGKIICREFFIAQDFVEVGGIAARGLSCGGNVCHAHRQQSITAAQSNLITHLHRARRLSRHAVHRHLPGLAQLLRNCPPQTQAAGFQKKVKTHSGIYALITRQTTAVRTTKSSPASAFKLPLRICYTPANPQSLSARRPSWVSHDCLTLR